MLCGAYLTRFPLTQPTACKPLRPLTEDIYNTPHHTFLTAFRIVERRCSGFFNRYLTLTSIFSSINSHGYNPLLLGCHAVVLKHTTLHVRLPASFAVDTQGHTGCFSVPSLSFRPTLSIYSTPLLFSISSSSSFNFTRARYAERLLLSNFDSISTSRYAPGHTSPAGLLSLNSCIQIPVSKQHRILLPDYSRVLLLLSYPPCCC